jgi:hypothetical protein
MLLTNLAYGNTIVQFGSTTSVGFKRKMESTKHIIDTEEVDVNNMMQKIEETSISIRTLSCLTLL